MPFPSFFLISLYTSSPHTQGPASPEGGKEGFFANREEERTMKMVRSMSNRRRVVGSFPEIMMDAYNCDLQAVQEKIREDPSLISVTNEHDEHFFDIGKMAAGSSMLLVACIKGNEPLVHWLLDNGGKFMCVSVSVLLLLLGLRVGLEGGTSSSDSPIPQESSFRRMMHLVRPLLCLNLSSSLTCASLMLSISSPHQIHQYQQTADIYERNADGFDAISAAVWSGNIKLVSLLIEKAYRLLKPTDTSTRLWLSLNLSLVWASIKGNDDVTELLRHHQSKGQAHAHHRPSRATTRHTAAALVL